MGTESNKDERNTPEYLAQLLKDKKQMQAFPNVFLHIERLLDDGKLWPKFFARSSCRSLCSVIRQTRFLSGFKFLYE